MEHVEDWLRTRNFPMRLKVMSDWQAWRLHALPAQCAAELPCCQIYMCSRLLTRFMCARDGYGSTMPRSGCGRQRRLMNPSCWKSFLTRCAQRRSGPSPESVLPGSPLDVELMMMYWITILL